MSVSDDDLMDDEADQKLQELWAKKGRRRSSELKILVEDHLKLCMNTKVNIQLSKNGEQVFTVHFQASLPLPSYPPDNVLINNSDL